MNYEKLMEKLRATGNLESFDERFLSQLGLDKETQSRTAEDSDSHNSNAIPTTDVPKEEPEPVEQDNKKEKEEDHVEMQNREDDANQDDKRTEDKQEAGDKKIAEGDCKGLTALNSSMLLKLSKPKSILFDLICGVCLDYSGPPQITCTNGHGICFVCYKSGMERCKTIISSSEDLPTNECGAPVSKIPDIVKSSEFYKYFAEKTRYTCGAWSLGCSMMEMKEAEVAQHELQECKFR